MLRTEVKKDLKQEKKLTRKNKGITLIALVVTIIVLLILAGISIMMLVGENGILRRAGESNRKTGRAQTVEIARMDVIDVQVKNDGKITKEEFEEVLSKYFTFDAENEDLPEDWKMYKLTTKNAKYNDILASEIYNGEFSNEDESSKVEEFEEYAITSRFYDYLYEKENRRSK